MKPFGKPFNRFKSKWLSQNRVTHSKMTLAREFKQIHLIFHCNSCYEQNVI